MNHQKLKCYGVLIETAKSLPALVARCPRGQGNIVDQLKRALSSAILNLCEGNGRTSKKERARFFDISLASIAESSAAIDVMDAWGLVSQASASNFKSNLDLAYAMIVNLKKASS